MDKYIDNCHDIYKRLQDETSKSIFESRVLFSLTGDIRKMHNVILATDEGAQIKEPLLSGQNNYIFGAGVWGKEMINVWPGCWQGVIDNDDEKNGKAISGLKITKLEEIGRKIIDTSANIFICTRFYYDEIHKQLLEFGIAEKIYSISVK